jgi:type IV pilus assembly protein PilA
MHRQNSTFRHGFTLIELMIIVAIVGILASIAVPGVTRYINSAKTTDGIDKLKGIAEGAITYYNQDHLYNPNGLLKLKYMYPGCQNTNEAYDKCSNATTSVVGGISQGTKHKLSIGPNEQPWLRLGFDISSDQASTYYQFVYGSSEDGHKFSARAEAKLSEDYFDSAFLLRGTADGTLLNMLTADDSAGSYTNLTGEFNSHIN